MYKIKDLYPIIEEALQKEQTNFPQQPEGLYEPIKYILSLGGKRLRPCLTLMACNLFSSNIEAAIRPALAFEVFHNFTLLHDDIMDRSPIRRGKETVHIKWDENTAILSGDAMQILAYKLFESSPADIFQPLIKLFSQTAIEVCEGQQYDMNFEKRNDVDIKEYIQMIGLKTSVLLAACLKAGALIGGADAEDAQNLYNFGLNAGIAFQLQDDYLDSFGDTAIFGKKTGGDIACNKKTFLMLKALELAQGATKTELESWINKASFDRDEKVAAVTKLYKQLKVDELSKEMMYDYYHQSLKYLDAVKAANEQKEELKSFAVNLIERVK